MAISKEAIDKFLGTVYADPPPCKGMAPDELRTLIYNCTGVEFEEKTPSRPHQLEGTAFALYMRQAFLFYWMRLGKALQEDTPVATPTGWRAINTLHIGDEVLHPSGKFTKIEGVFPQGLRAMYRVTFTDGAETICDEEHLWTVQNADAAYYKFGWKTKTTQEIKQTILRDAHSNAWKYRIPLPANISYPEETYTIDPYTLGVLLGDGSLSQDNLSITTDKEILDTLPLPAQHQLTLSEHTSPGIMYGSIRSTSKKTPNLIRQTLRDLKLAGTKSATKFIPKNYLLGTHKQRWALLNGLLDTDGWVQGSNNVQWGSVSLQLAYDMQELVRSFGGTASLNTTKPTYAYKGKKLNGQTFYSMSIRLAPELGCPFRLQRKADKWKPIIKYRPMRAIANIEITKPANAVCIKVAHPDGLFVIKDYVVTHNTKIALDWASHLKRAQITKKKGLILAHATVGVTEWESQVAEHSYLVARSVRSGALMEDDFLDACMSNCDLIIMSRFTMQEMFTQKRLNRKNKPTLYPDEDLLATAADFFDHSVIDETHFYSGQYSLPFTLASSLTKQCSYRLGLTGTPVGRNPYVLWAQAHLVDKGKRFGYNYAFFEAAFGKQVYSHFTTSNKVYVFDKKKLDLFQYKLDSFALAYGKGEVKTASVETNIVRLKMSKEQARAYDDACNRMYQIRDQDEIALKSIFHRLRQIASGYLPFTDEQGRDRMVHFESAKLAWLTAFVSELPADCPCLIFHEYIHSGELIAKTLKAAKVTFTELRGDTKDPDAAIAAFRSGKAQFLVANSQKGGTGINLPETEYVLFFESPVDPRQREQAASRPMARGDRSLTLDDLVCAPIEDRILGFIAEGQNLLARLLAGGKKTAKELFS